MAIPRAWPPASSRCVDREPAPLRMMLGSHALDSTISTLQERIAAFEEQRDLAASTDFLPGG
ncbi:hypothetical protein [Amycolatopsis sp. lyj-109]|uniref:hypothetical protein n=1 Tax=Amycolatopsis sp. lyj-109 TaxID=2789287 RepID=UPI00397C3D97